MEFHPGSIDGVVWKPLRRYHDARGWVCEMYRHDELAKEFYPVMGYISATEPGVARGPHEHVEQADCFCFMGPSSFKIYLWDNRPSSPTHLAYFSDVVGADKPMMLIIPPGVVHAYRNVGKEAGIVYNFPNQLYKGWNRKDPVDEIRHEDDQSSRFRLVD